MKNNLKKKCTFFLAEKWVGNVEYQYTLMWNRFNIRLDIKIFCFLLVKQKIIGK